MSSGYGIYRTDESLQRLVESKKINIENEIFRRTGIKQKITLRQVQKYLALELKKPKITFDISLWNQIVTGKCN